MVQKQGIELGGSVLMVREDVLLVAQDARLQVR